MRDDVRPRRAGRAASRPGRSRLARGARLGQHFLIHAWPARFLAHAVRPSERETIVEIGPGKGILTRELLARGPVIAIEKDEVLCARLRETFAGGIASGRLTLIEGDVRDFDSATIGGDYVLAANIPYYITGEIIRQFLTAEHQPLKMALLIQKEVAQRITSEKESLLSLSVKAYGTPRIVEKVSRMHFSPPPSVDSAILFVGDISRRFFEHLDEHAFFELLRVGFASKRKMLAGNLSSLYVKEQLASAFGAAGIHEKARAENVSLEQWKSLYQLLRSSQHRNPDA